MTKGIFVTATGTDVGKTFISALLVKKMRDMNLNCGYFKPALSGAELINGELIPGDCDYVLKTAGIMDRTPLECASYVLKTAVSPHLAAELENQEIKKEKIKADFDNIKKDYDYMVVEGAGGIICPFNLSENNKILLEDVIKMLECGVIVVASADLGTINYTYLTIHYLKSIGINVRGIIINYYNENDIMCRDNKLQVEKLCGVKVIATVKQDDKDLRIDENELLSIFKEI